MKRVTLTAAVASAVALAIAGCGAAWSNGHSHNTAPGRYSAARNQIIEYPYGWDNIAFTCFKGNGIYEVLDTSYAITVITADPACAA